MTPPSRARRGTVVVRRPRVGRGSRRPASDGRVTLSGSLRGIGSRARAAADLETLRRVIERRAGRPVRLDIETMSDADIRRLNRTWLEHDFATDVISFPLSDPQAPRLDGALAVSRDTARREAARRGHAPYHEWMLYVVHGTLHLLGHDDGAPAARRRMRRAEFEVLAALGLPPVFGREAAAGGRGR